jgi:hypothetical protein
MLYVISSMFDNCMRCAAVLRAVSALLLAHACRDLEKGAQHCSLALDLWKQQCGINSMSVNCAHTADVYSDAAPLVPSET